MELDLSTTEDFIHGDVFNVGIDNAIFEEPVPQENPVPSESFIIVFDSVNNKILASTSRLVKKDTEMGLLQNAEYKTNQDTNGGTLFIENIDTTKNCIGQDDETIYTADGFAIIRAFPISDTEDFPDFSKETILLIRSKLDNKPVFNKNTKFTFNKSTINFGAANSDL